MKLEVIDNGKNFRLLEDLEKDGTLVPKGFIWDAASVPWIATRIIPRSYRTLEPSCLHDYRCRHAKDGSDRKLADKLFEKDLRQRGFSWIRAKAGYIGVRIGAFFGIGVKYPHWTSKVRKLWHGMVKKTGE